MALDRQDSNPDAEDWWARCEKPCEDIGLSPPPPPRHSATSISIYQARPLIRNCLINRAENPSSVTRRLIDDATHTHIPVTSRSATFGNKGTKGGTFKQKLKLHLRFAELPKRRSDGIKVVGQQVVDLQEGSRHQLTSPLIQQRLKKHLLRLPLASALFRQEHQP